MRYFLSLACAALLTIAGRAAALELPAVWPAPAPGAVAPQRVAIPSRTPFTIRDIAAGRGEPLMAAGELYLPPEASAAAPVPAVVLLHGSGGVRSSREPTYARQLATMGVAGLVIDVFAPRRDIASGFVERILNITEAAYIQDAFAALDWLAERADIDAERVAVIGFSYGGMAALYAAYDQVAAAAAPDGRRFAAHVSFYGPCIASFVDPDATGAPILMLMGDGDATVDPERCRATAEELRQGGAPVEMIVYAGARHQWDGSRGPWRAPRHIADCSFRVERDGTVRDASTRIEMGGPTTRALLLGLCSDSEGYVIERNDAVRLRSNADLAEFLKQSLGESEPRS